MPWPDEDDRALEYTEVGGGVISTPGAFTPAMLPSLVAWYKADTGVTGTNPVTAVADQSGHSYNLGNTGGSVVLNATGINGFPAFEFATGNSGALVTSANVVNINSSVYTFYAVVTQRAACPVNAPAISFVSAGSNDASATDSIIPIINDSTATALSAFKDGTNFGRSVVTSGTPVRFGCIASASTLTLYLNGSASGTTFANPPDTLTSAGTITLGARRIADVVQAAFWDGFVGEVVVTAADATGSITNLDNYYKTRFGL